MIQCKIIHAVALDRRSSLYVFLFHSEAVSKQTKSACVEDEGVARYFGGNVAGIVYCYVWYHPIE